MRSLTAEERVVELLQTLLEAREAWHGGNGDGVRMMPSMYHEGSYAELERGLRLQRELWPGQYRAVASEYIWPCTHTADVVVGTRIIDGGVEKILQRRVVEGAGLIRPATSTPAATRKRQLREGVNWITQMMYEGRTDRIVLPRGIFLEATA